ncbi:MAG: hypothetical protein ACK5NN_10850 [Sphingomonadaceae bacterium]
MKLNFDPDYYAKVQHGYMVHEHSRAGYVALTPFVESLNRGIPVGGDL